MQDYPSIIPSAKAPRQPCVGFEKIDGTNIRVKYTQKRGFCLFGTRSQIFDATHPEYGSAVDIFHREHAPQLTKLFKRQFPNEREINVFMEFAGPSSIAGIHIPEEPKTLTIFDVLLVQREELLLPREFIKLIAPIVLTPSVIYEGNLNEELIADVRAGKYNVNEGIICKGTLRTKYAFGGIWMCKIKTNAYFDKLRLRFGPDWAKYGE